jgi:hypothetical protein
MLNGLLGIDSNLAALIVSNSLSSKGAILIHQFNDAELSNPPYNRANEHRGCHRVHASVICYAIKSKKLFRFLTEWDVKRWGTNKEALHEQAVDNLAALPWPREVLGARMKNEGRVLIVDTDDSLAASRLLHPELHTLFSPALGSTFFAGIPCRNTLVLFSDRKALKARIGRRLRQDYKASPYPITPRPFLVTRDGIAAAA